MSSVRWVGGRARRAQPLSPPGEAFESGDSRRCVLHERFPEFKGRDGSVCLLFLNGQSAVETHRQILSVIYSLVVFWPDSCNKDTNRFR